MKTVNKYIVLFAASLALMTAGGAVYITMAQEKIIGDRAMTVPEGAENYAYIEIIMPGGGPVSGTYECLSGGTVMVMVLDGGQFDRFVDGQDHGSRFAAAGSSGSFSIEQIDMERCYIVLHHGGGGNASQDVRVTYEVDTLDSNGSWLAMALVIAGAAVGAGGTVLQVMRKKASMPSPKYLDVVFFDEKGK